MEGTAAQHYYYTEFKPILLFSKIMLLSSTRHSVMSISMKPRLNWEKIPAFIAFYFVRQCSLNVLHVDLYQWQIIIIIIVFYGNLSFCTHAGEKMQTNPECKCTSCDVTVIWLTWSCDLRYIMPLLADLWDHDTGYYIRQRSRVQSTHNTYWPTSRQQLNSKL